MSGSLGHGFSLGVPLQISALGFLDADEDGLLATHAIGLFDAGSQTLLASASVPAGSGAWLQGGFRWVDIPLTTLPPGSYVIAATIAGDPATFDPVLFDATDPSGSTGFVMGSSSLSLAGSGTIVAFPSVDEGLPYGFVGPNLATSPVPGPLPLLGAGVAFRWSRRLRRRLRRPARQQR